MASKLKSYIKPDDSGGYYLGAVIPDIRYLAKMRREQTHFGQAQIQKFISCYPYLESFLLGFRVHCLLDEIDFTHVVSSTFPLNMINRILHKNLTQQQTAILIELFYIQTTHMDWEIKENHNEVLADLGITPSQTQTYLGAMKEYLASPSFETALTCFQKIGLIESSRFEKYMKAYQAIQRNKAMKAILFLSIKKAKLDQYVVRNFQPIY
jgi:hypothetical protein